MTKYPRVPEIEDPRIRTVYYAQHYSRYAQGLDNKDHEQVLRLKQNLAGLYQQFQVQLGQGSLLDIACGMAGFTRQLARVYHDQMVIGIDSDPDAITFARNEKTQYANLELKIGDAYHLEEYKNSFGIITCMNALHHLELSSAIKQAAQALKATGILWIHDFDRSKITNAYDEQMLDEMYRLREARSDAEVLAEFERRGFFKTQEQTLEVATLFSMMAAYTEAEVKNELIANGILPFNGIEDPHLFNILGIKLH